MKVSKPIKDFLFFGSVYYTVITVAIIAIASFMSESDSAKLVETSQFLKILLFSFVMSLGSTLLRLEPIPKTVGILIHATCYIIGFLVFAVLCGAGFSVTAILTAVFALLYLIFTVAVRIILKKAKNSSSSLPTAEKPVKKRLKKEKYTSQFISKDAK